MRERTRRTAGWLRRRDPGWWCLGAGLLFVLVAWWPVVTGDRTLLGGDILYGINPWSDGGAHVPHNPILSDPITQFVPWLTLTRHDLATGQLPLWNPYSLNGTPLLGNGTSAVLSPFTWVALLFQPDRGYSLAMLLRFVVAGTGMAFLVRRLGARGISAAFAGISYASCSFMVVWLAHPQSGVAALLPWAFGFVELYLATRGARALAGVAVVTALQFFAGNEETSFHMGIFLAAWVVVRALVQPEMRIRRLAALAAAGTLGAALAAVQLLPFLAGLQGSSLAGDRQRAGVGLGALSRSEVASWLIPNGHGNPGIDQVIGRLPNYAESTAFIGVGALLLIGPGAWLLWRTRRSAGVLLVGGLLFSVLTMYGVITPVVGRLPGFNSSASTRLIVLACFCAAACAGMGLELLLRRPVGTARRLAMAPLALAVAGILGLCACALILKRQGAAVDGLLGPVHGQIGFWVAVLALSAASAVLLLGAARLGVARPWVGGGFFTLALAEALLFAVPFQPRTAVADNPPPSAAMDWLATHAGNDKFAAPGLTAIPNLSVRYQIDDTRGVDVILNSRLRTFWRAADPAYNDDVLYTQLFTPGVDWLAAAGVRWYLTDPRSVLPRTVVRFSSTQTSIAEVPDSRPFAFGVDSASVVSAPDADAAAVEMARDPLGPVVVEGCCGVPRWGARPPVLHAVTVASRDQGTVTLDVTMPGDGVVVVLQSFDPGWSATLDGAAAAVHPADVLFQAVSVPRGSHRVVLRYRPSTVLVGAAISTVSLLLVALLCVPAAWRGRMRGPIGVIRRRRPRPTAAP